MNLSPLMPLHAGPADTPADDKPSIIMDGGTRSDELGSDEAFIQLQLSHICLSQRYVGLNTTALL